MLLGRSSMVYRWAPVLHPAAARVAAETGARVLTVLSTTTPERTSNLVGVLGETVRGGAVWVHVQLPILPTGATGWVPRSALGGYRFVHTRLVVDLERLRATLLADGRPVFRAPVGVGRSDSPTPKGEFYVRDRLTWFRNLFYGPVAFGTSARSPVLTDWPGGGFIGIHGTNEPGLLPGRISHGCVRMRNGDIRRLARLMPVGTRLTIR